MKLATCMTLIGGLLAASGAVAAIFQLNVTGPWSVTYLNPADDPRKQ